MKRSSGLRKAVTFSGSVQRRLNMYALAASATGVSLLALAGSAEGKIVYTPSNAKIDGGVQYKLDLNHDGITDFVIQNSRFSGRNCVNGQNVFNLLNVNGNGNAIEGKFTPSYYYASALGKGAKIGGSQAFVGAATLEGWNYGWIKNRYHFCARYRAIWGHWYDVTQSYLGFKFLVRGKTHYGWARLNVQLVSGKGIVAKLTGYAYETIPGKSIIAGQTMGPQDEWDQDDFGPDASLARPAQEMPQAASLGILALGSQGISLWRRSA
jgi:hypothetical protein